MVHTVDIRCINVAIFKYICLKLKYIYIILRMQLNYFLTIFIQLNFNSLINNQLINVLNGFTNNYLIVATQICC